ncbi:hypothetical protein PG988_006166 [Apiospora saccharicola]
MSDDRVEYDQLKALLCGGKDDFIQAIRMVNEGKVSTDDLADAIVATKNKEFMDGWARKLIKNGRLNLDNLRPPPPGSNKAKDDRLRDEGSQGKKP